MCLEPFRLEVMKFIDTHLAVYTVVMTNSPPTGNAMVRGIAQGQGPGVRERLNMHRHSSTSWSLHAYHAGPMTMYFFLVFLFLYINFVVCLYLF